MFAFSTLCHALISETLGDAEPLQWKGKHFQVRLGSRAVLSDVYDSLGLSPDKFMAVCLVLDKMGKIPEDVTRAMLKDEQLSDSEIDKVLSLMTIKSIDDAEQLLGHSTQNTEDVKELLSLMTDAGFKDYVLFDFSIIRGLSYYTGIVFEAFDTNRKLRAIFGGGRYDDLLSSLGGDPIPCVGFGFGDVVVQELLTSLGKLQEIPKSIDVAIGFMTENERSFAIKIASLFRQQNLRVDLSLTNERAKKFFSHANKNKAKYAIYLGPDEASSTIIGIKDLQKGQQRNVPLSDIESGLDLHLLW